MDQGTWSYDDVGSKRRGFQVNRYVGFNSVGGEGCSSLTRGKRAWRLDAVYPMDVDDDAVVRLPWSEFSARMRVMKTSSTIVRCWNE